MNYSICYLHDSERAQRSEFAPFDDDAAALQNAREELDSTPPAEVSRNYVFMDRLDPAPRQAETRPAWGNEGVALAGRNAAAQGKMS